MHQEKFDIYDFGIILLEIISGRLIISEREVVVLKDQVYKCNFIRSNLSLEPTLRFGLVTDTTQHQYCEIFFSLFSICIVLEFHVLFVLN